MSEINVTISKRIARPIEIVRAHFFDIEHHARNDVHAGIKFTVLQQGPQGCRFKQEARLLGIKQVDEMLISKDESSGAAVQQYLSGLNAGGKIIVSFRPDGDAATLVDASVALPAHGIKKVLAPFFRYAVRKLGEKTLEEDRKDLEENGYQPSTSNVRPGS